MSLQQKALKGVIWTALQNWGSQALFFITFLVLARLLGPKTFGLVSMANVFIHFVQALLGQSFADAIVQRKDLEDEHLDTAFWINLAIGICLFILGLLAAPFIAISFKEPQLVAIIRYLSFSVVLNALSSTHQAILRRNLNFKDLALRQLVGQTFGSIVAIVLAFSGFGVWSIVNQQLLSNLVGTILLWKMTPWQPKLRVSKRHFQDLFSFGINVVGINILVFASLRSDDLLIGYYLGPIALGYYTVAYRLLVTLMQLLTDTMRQVVLPTFARLQDDLEKMRQTLFTATELLSFVAIPIFVGMGLVANEVVLSLFGPQWVNSIPVMQILCAVGLLQSLFNFNGAVIMSMGKASWNLGLMTVETIAKIIAFFIGVHWGIVAVAWGLLIAIVIFIPARLFLLRKLLHFNVLEYLDRYRYPFISAALMSGVLTLTKSSLSSRIDIHILLGICIVLGAITYLSSLWFLAPEFIKKIQKIVLMLKSRSPQKNASLSEAVMLESSEKLQEETPNDHA